MVGSIIWVLLEIYLAFQQLKNFENPLRIDKVIAMSLVWFLGHPVYVTLLHPTQRVELRSDILHHHTYHSIISAGTICRNRISTAATSTPSRIVWTEFVARTWSSLWLAGPHGPLSSSQHQVQLESGAAAPGKLIYLTDLGVTAVTGYNSSRFSVSLNCRFTIPTQTGLFSIHCSKGLKSLATQTPKIFLNQCLVSSSIILSSS